jgi:general secretion pathway protein G
VEPARQDACRGVTVRKLEERKNAMQNRMSPSVRSGASRAFTLLEVMIVIVIILAILGLVTVNLMGTKKSADTKLVQVQLGSLKGALDAFYLDFNRYPTEEEGLAVLWNKDGLAEEEQSKWRMYTKEALPRDPWQSAWGYQLLTAEDAADATGGAGYKVWSNGPDKEEGTADDILPPGLSGDTDDTGGDVGPPPPGGN